MRSQVIGASGSVGHVEARARPGRGAEKGVGRVRRVRSQGGGIGSGDLLKNVLASLSPLLQQMAGAFARECMAAVTTAVEQAIGKVSGCRRRRRNSTQSAYRVGKFRAGYPQRLRRVVALVEVDGKDVEMTFLTNHLTWSAWTVAELYRCRWDIEVFFKEIKQTLQLADFLGHSANAVRWQIWIGLLVHLLLRYLAYRTLGRTVSRGCSPFCARASGAAGIWARC